MPTVEELHRRATETREQAEREYDERLAVDKPKGRTMKFRKKPVAIEAFKFRPVWRAGGACADNAPVWFLQAENEGIAKVWGDDEVPYCMIRTLEGSMKANAGDWIIRGVKGEIYPCKPDIFEATYEAAS